MVDFVRKVLAVTDGVAGESQVDQTCCAAAGLLKVKSFILVRPENDKTLTSSTNIDSWNTKTIH